jgi:hypothetical protein
MTTEVRQRGGGRGAVCVSGDRFGDARAVESTI